MKKCATNKSSFKEVGTYISRSRLREGEFETSIEQREHNEYITTPEVAYESMLCAYQAFKNNKQALENGSHKEHYRDGFYILPLHFEATDKAQMSANCTVHETETKSEYIHI